MSKLSANDWVEVRSKEEILRTLDKQGRLDGMPFMPQMFEYCGRRFKVYKRAHKTCDVTAAVWNDGGRSLPDGIHLDLRCDGRAYGGCQAACLIFWKEQWLNRVDGPAERARSPQQLHAHRYEGAGEGHCTEDDVLRATRARDTKSEGEPIYACQATRVREFTKPLRWWDARQYLQDYLSGNVSLWQIARGTLFICFFNGTLARSRRFGGPARWVYDRFQALWGGIPWPRYRGRLPASQPGPIATLNLQPGEFVRIKPYEEILATIDVNQRNRGMTFDAEMVPYCGRTYRVRTRIERFIDEKTGKMKSLTTPAVILDDVICQARYSCHRMYCPRSIFAWWREVWLERVSACAELQTEQGSRDGVRRDAA